MPTLKQKNVIKSYKLRLQEKLKAVTEETEKASFFLNNCVSEFRNRVDQILKIKDEKCLSLYRNLIQDLENYSEKLFILQASFEDVSDEESECSEDEQSTAAMCEQQSLPRQPHTEVKFPVPSVSQDVDLKSSDFQNTDEDSVTDEKFCSLHSVDVPKSSSLNSHIDAPRTSQHVDRRESESNISASQNSFYSISSNINEPFVCRNDTRSVLSLGATVQESNTKDSIELPSERAIILPGVLEVSRKYNAVFSHIVDPSNFWILLEKSNFNLTYPRSESSHFRSLSSIKEGDYCLAPFGCTSFYYRAQSLSDAQSALEEVKVLFIDHGSSQDIPLSDLRCLPESAYSIPAQAFHCYLYGIVPIGDSWCEESSEKLKNFQHCIFEAIVVSKEDLHGVDLVARVNADLAQDFSLNLSLALCIDGLAVAVSDPPGQYVSMRGAYDAYAVSNDSGVSVSCPERSNNFDRQEDEIVVKAPSDCVPPVTIKTSEAEFPDRNLVISNQDMQVKDLILFNSHETLEEFPNSCEEVDSLASSCPVCRKTDFCLHLAIPSPSLSFVEKDMVLVMLSNIVSPGEFYVNMAQENIMTLDDLREQMTNLYDSQTLWHLVKVEDLSENMYCAGRFYQDKYWYRIKVLRVSSEDIEKEQALVQYVDYGNVDIISCRDIQPLTESFSQHPIFAIKCYLAGVTPLKMGNSEWGDAIREFKNMTSYERCLTAQICTEICQVQNDSYPVLLWDSEDSKDLLINSLLAEQKVALFNYSLLDTSAANQSDLKPLMDMDAWNPMEEEFYQTENNYAMDDENLEMVTTGYQAKDEKYTCKYFSLRGYCRRGDNCPYEHQTLLETGVTRDQEEVFCLDTSPIPSKNISNILMQVSAIVTPSCFYAILPFGCKTVDEIDRLIYSGVPPSKVANCEAKALFRALDKYYSKSPFQENTTISLSCGTIVAAKRHFDGKWHRARIVDVVGVNKPAKAFFVDSGDQEWVSRRLIRTIKNEFLHTPFQAIQCSLHQIDPIGCESGPTWSSEAVQYFKDIVMGEVLLAETVRRIGPVFQVSLRQTSRDNHQIVGELLISAGLAQPSQSVAVDNRGVRYVPG